MRSFALGVVTLASGALLVGCYAPPLDGPFGDLDEAPSTGGVEAGTGGVGTGRISTGGVGVVTGGGGGGPFGGSGGWGTGGVPPDIGPIEGTIVFPYSVCVGDAPDLVGDLEAAEEYDYVALRRVNGLDSPVTILDAAGVACLNGNAACYELLGEPQETGIFAYATTATRHDVLTTFGSSVMRRTTLEGVLDLLGPIDTASEAALLVTLRGYRVTCDEPNLRYEHTGYWILARRGGGTCSPHTLAEIFVDRTGGLTIHHEWEVAGPHC